MFMHSCLILQWIWAFWITLLEWWVIAMYPWGEQIPILPKIYSNATEKKTSLHCLWPRPELGRVWKTAASIQSKPSHVTNLGTQGPQHMTQTGTRTCPCDPTWLNWTNAWERFWRRPCGQAQLPSVPCATWHTCCGKESLEGYLASIQIPEYLPRASVYWGLFTVNRGLGLTPWNYFAWGHIGKLTWWSVFA